LGGFGVFYLLSPLDLTASNLAPIADPSQIRRSKIRRDGHRRGASRSKILHCA
jgi:hypothetical protein